MLSFIYLSLWLLYSLLSDGFHQSGLNYATAPRFRTNIIHRSVTMQSDVDFIGEFSKALDKSVLGALKSIAVPKLDVDKSFLNNLQSPATGFTELSKSFGNLPAFPKVQLDSFLPATLSEVNFDVASLDNIDLSSNFFVFFDVAKWSFFPENVLELLIQQPQIVRLGLGLISLEVVPTVLYFVFIQTLWKNLLKNDVNVDVSGLPKTYNRDIISKFYFDNPGIVVRRIIGILIESKDLISGILLDRFTNKISENRPERARQLRELLIKLGPAYIKVGQGLSVRPDLLNPDYLAELSKLQDQVPPFDSELALQLLKNELKREPKDVFLTLDAFKSTVAAASLGQVYRAKLKNGTEVAVKIQRPNMLLTVSLDLFVTRTLFELGTNIESIAEQCAGFISVIDNWAGRFIDELDYEKEVQNSEKFRMQMADRTTTLGEAIVVPVAFPEYSSGKVLVTEWIEGTKLSAIDLTTSSGKETVKKLTSVLLNSYLVQLLETGFLHADPHPGNFQVTSEGKLCIMDYGLMTEVEEDKRFALLQYVSHLLAKDYSGTLDDLVILGFIPQDVTDDPSKKAIVAPLLANILEQLSAGGGADSINIEQVGKEIDILAEQYPLVIPAYFGLVLRAFGALEGLGLSADRKYSIVKDCFPYLARRLLSDDSPKIRLALKTFLYGEKGRLDVNRVDELAQGYRTFTKTAADAASGKAFEELRYAPVAEVSDGGTDPTVTAAIKILFSPQGNFVQELILEEVVNIVDALTRSISATTLRNTRKIASNPWSLFSGSVGTSSEEKDEENPIALRYSDSNSNDEVNRMSVINPLQSTTSSQRRSFRPNLKFLNPFYRIEVATKRLESIVSLSDDDIDSLKTLKRLLQILAGVETESRLARSTGGGSDAAITSISSTSKGLLDLEDLKLVRLALSKLSSININNGVGEKNNEKLREQLQSILPILQDIAPGIRVLLGKFGRRLASRSLSRLADRINNDASPVPATN